VALQTEVVGLFLVAVQTIAFYSLLHLGYSVLSLLFVCDHLCFYLVCKILVRKLHLLLVKVFGCIVE
jgi:hypothetical protein